MKPMVYIIHNRMIWILYDDRMFREYYIPKYFPSWREEYWRPATVIRL
jgi:hypothetical protein